MTKQLDVPYLDYAGEPYDQRQGIGLPSLSYTTIHNTCSMVIFNRTA